jgi:hypothetical protein
MIRNIFLLVVLVIISSMLVSGCCCCAFTDESADWLTKGGLISEFSSVVEGTGKIKTQEFKLSGFNQVDISSSFEVQITQGEEFNVLVHADEAVFPYLNVAVQGDTLGIGIDSSNISLFKVNILKAEVIMPELNKLKVSGTSEVDVEGFDSEKNLQVDLSGASGLDLTMNSGKVNLEISGSSKLRGKINAGDINLTSSGASSVNLAGSGEDLIVESSGSSDVDLSELSVEDARIDASGASKIMVNASGTLNVHASGASSIYYLNNPSMGNIDVEKSSKLEPK